MSGNLLGQGQTPTSVVISYYNIIYRPSWHTLQGSRRVSDKKLLQKDSNLYAWVWKNLLYLNELPASTNTQMEHPGDQKSVPIIWNILA